MTTNKRSKESIERPYSLSEEDFNTFNVEIFNLTVSINQANDSLKKLKYGLYKMYFEYANVQDD